MSRIILHVGTHKTATTTLQRHLARNREALAARGIWYPDYGLIGHGAHYAHLGIVNALAGQHEKFSVADAQAFFRAVLARVPDQEATILSAEPFYRHVAYERPGVVPDEPEAYWPLRRAYVENVRALLAPHPAEIVVVFRRQADYAHSLYQEQVKTTRYREDFRAFRRQFWYHFDYLGQARAWAEAFGGLTALRFEDLVAGDGPVRNLGARLGLDLSGPEAVVQQNVSLHPDAVVLKRLLHATKIDKDVLRAQIEAVVGGPLSRRVRKFKNRSLYADAADLAAFQAGFAADNAELARAFFPELPAGAPLFSPDFPGNLRFGDALHPHFLAMLLQALAERTPKGAARAETPAREDAAER
jgi:hypothetical protein